MSPRKVKTPPLRRAAAKALHILVVDDEKTNVELMSRYLEKCGYRVDYASDGQEALVHILHEIPDLILLDIGMPVLDGLSVCTYLRGDFRTRGIPIIVVTGKDSLEDRLHGYQAGIDDFITKPFDLEELKIRIECTLQRRRWDQWSHPLTHLPGSPAIEEVVQNRLSLRDPFVFAYIDIDNFKAYNDVYGYDAGDHVIRDLAHLLINTSAQYARGVVFPGHVGGDDFVLIAPEETMRLALPEIVCQFDARRGDYYHTEDLRRGHITCKNRVGIIQTFPLMALSIAVVSPLMRADADNYVQLVQIASELKKRIKNQDHRKKSLVVWDRRSPLPLAGHPR